MTAVQTSRTYLPFRSAAVLGAGVMGSQIAAHLANAGLRVHLLDLPGEGADKNILVEEAFSRARRASPDPFFVEKTARRITLGNFEEHFGRIAGVDWVIEAVVENLEIKAQLLQRVEETASERALISTNTSGIPIRAIVRECSASFKKRFLGTHFFNPPRYLRLLEVIPHAQTDPAALERIAWFGRLHLGKGVVVARDVPGFIGNRIGVYVMMHGVRALVEGGYSLDEIDALTGPLVGRPRSATFRTADLVGLDTFAQVAQFLYEALPHDQSRQGFQVPELVEKLVEGGALGAKAGRGFYRREGEVILCLDPRTMAYASPQNRQLGNLEQIQQQRQLGARLRALYAERGRAGAFFRRYILDICAYSARCLPEIAASPAHIDRAMRWGFAWEMGPFEMWDALGFSTLLEDMRAAEASLPEWVGALEREGGGGFYRGAGAAREVCLPGRGYARESPPADEISLAAIKDGEKTLWRNDEAALLDLGEEVALFEFRSKANSLGRRVVAGLLEVVDRIEREDFRGLVIGNEGRHFSVGANLSEVAAAVQEGRFDEVEQMLRNFQRMILRVRYAAKPVVVATHARALGGGCELALACAHPVAAAESCLGLVEVGVGLIPAGGGTTSMAARAHREAPDEDPAHIQPYLAQAFETVATAKVSSSAHQAQECGFLPSHTRIVMNAARRLYVAREEVLRLSNQGYAPPPPRAIKVLGRPGCAQLEVRAYNLLQSRYITEYERYLAGRLAYAMTGGELSAPALVDEEYLLELEREVFLSLLGEEKTQQRIASILQQNKPLRN